MPILTAPKGQIKNFIMNQNPVEKFDISPNEVASAPDVDWAEWRQLFPGVSDPAEMWHMLYYYYDPVNFFKSVAAYYNSVDDNAKIQYAKTISNWLTKNQNNTQLIDKMFLLDTPTLMQIAGHILPAYSEWANSVFIARDQDGYIEASLNLNKLLPDSEKSKQAYAFTTYLRKYGKPGWENKIPSNIISQSNSQSEEDLKFDSAGVNFNMTPGAGKIFAGIAVGGFLIWGASRIFLGGRKKA